MVVLPDQSGHRHPRIRAGAVVACIVAFGALSAACTGTGFTYVKNTQARSYFKVPSDWKLFEEDEIFASKINNLSPQGEAAAKAALWMIAFDADPKPSLDHLLDGASTYPEGFAQVRQLSQQARDAVSLAFLRNVLFPVDQIAAQSSGDLEVLRSQELVQQDGIHGLRLVFNVRREDAFLTVDQTVLVDAATTYLHLFVIGCEANCYVANTRLIDDIVTSWTVKER
jgi:hypothetical protein